MSLQYKYVWRPLSPLQTTMGLTVTSSLVLSLALLTATATYRLTEFVPPEKWSPSYLGYQEYQEYQHPPDTIVSIIQL